MTVTTVRNLLVLGACCATRTNAFSTPSSSLSQPPTRLSTASSTTLRFSNNYLDSIGSSPQDSGPVATGSGNGRNGPNPQPQPSPGRNSPPPPPPPFADPEPPSIDLNGRIQNRPQSNLFRQTDRGFPPDNRSINEDPRQFDMERRFSQAPVRRPAPPDEDPFLRPRQAWWDSTPTSTVQGSSRRTFQAPFDRDSSRVFLETDGRPLDVEFELWDGPNNAPTKMKVYSEDGRLRPFNAMVENPMKGMRGNTLSVRNTGPMEFPLRAGVESVVDMDVGMGRSDGIIGGSGLNGRNGGRGLAGSERAYLDPTDMRGSRRQLGPSMNRGQIVQGGALRTFPLDYSVEAAQVTIVTDGLPMYAKVELWGTSTHVKQIAEIYNDNGQTRPFSAIVDTPGGSNTIAITNTGPMEYPIRVMVEPVSRMDGWNGEDPRFGGVTAPW